MQVAEVLSDLTSLQVCDQSAALALVSMRPKSADDQKDNASNGSTAVDTDPDLERAKDLLELHTTVKVAHQDGTDHELNRARQDVERVLSTLK